MNTEQADQDESDAGPKEPSVKNDELQDEADRGEAKAKIEYYEQMYSI